MKFCLPLAPSRRWSTAFGPPASLHQRVHLISVFFVSCGATNARLRDELLNGEIFYTLGEAQVLIESWRRSYVRTAAWDTGRRLQKRSCCQAFIGNPVVSRGKPQLWVCSFVGYASLILEFLGTHRDKNL